MLQTPLTTPDQLWHWCHAFLGLRIPRTPTCPNHQAPFDYLIHTYFEPASDLVVWAPRGGGKTRLAAVATLLDLLHKPPTSVRILGGSLDQSLRLWEHLLPDIHRLLPQDQFSAVKRALTLTTGSTAAALPQSQRAVRGLRVQKMRCDEVELFDPAVLDAAKLVTRSKQLPSSKLVAGTVECISTMHLPHGIMADLVQSTSTRVIKWCALEVIQPCPPSRDCNTCPLWEDCQGRAKNKTDGFVPIDDLIAMKRRVSKQTWDSEILCQRPMARGAVFPQFSRDAHLRTLPIPSHATWNIAVDFGFTAPFVALWIASFNNLTYVVDEYVQRQRSLAEHAAEIRSRPWPAKKISCDPAGSSHNDQTSISNVTLLKKEGFQVKHQPSSIAAGLDLIRAALSPAQGGPKSATLLIHPRCQTLIKALESYRYPDHQSDLPLKDGTHDHPIDALRYHYVTHQTSNKVTVRNY